MPSHHIPILPSKSENIIHYTRVTKVSAADINPGPTLDRHYSNIGGRCW